MISIFNKIERHMGYYTKMLRDYRTQKSKFPKSRIKFYNYGFSSNNLQDYWFYKFIEHHRLNDRNKTISFISVFGNKKIIHLLRGIKIFFSGENLNKVDTAYPGYLGYADHYGDKVDLALGFNHKQNMGKNYMRLPLWIHYFVPPDSTLESLRELILKYNSIETRTNKDRDRFAVHIARHDKNGVRKEIIEALNEIEQVCCAGKFMNNSKELSEIYKDNKLEFLKSFKFNICPENSNTDGYVTEKLFHSIMAGCIPIYWGANNLPEPEIINPQAVLFYDRKNKEDLIEQVLELRTSEKAYQDFLKIPPFKEDAAEHIWSYMEGFKNRMKEAIENN